MNFHELLHDRNLSSTTIGEIALTTSSYCDVGYHLIRIPFYTEIVGLHISALGSSYTNALPPADTVARMWLMTRDVQTFLPDFVIAGSDTKLGTTNYQLQVGNDSPLKINSSCPGGDYSIDFFYPNPIIVSQPDYIYVGVAIQNDGGGRFRASFTANNPCGMADLDYTHTTKPLKTNILSWIIPEQISYTHLQISSSAVLANMNICLITQQPTGGVPYLRPQVQLP